MKAEGSFKNMAGLKEGVSAVGSSSQAGEGSSIFNLFRTVLSRKSEITGFDDQGNEVEDGVETIEYDLSMGRVSVYRPEPGCGLDVSSMTAAHHERKSQFNMGFFDLASTFTPLLNSTVPEDLRWREDSEEVRVLGFRQPRAVEGPLEKIAEIARLPIRQIREQGLDKVFRDNLKTVCLRLHERTEWKEEAAVLVPLRGGALVANIIPVPPENIIPIDSKRVPLARKGHLGLGLNLPGSDELEWKGLYNWMDERIGTLDNKFVRILEVAIASGMTTSAFLLNFANLGVRPSHIEIVSPVVAQQGVEMVLAVADSLDLDVSVTAGQMYYRLADFWKGSEDSLVNDKGEFVIGRATTILEDFLKLNRFTPNELNGVKIEPRGI